MKKLFTVLLVVACVGLLFAQTKTDYIRRRGITSDDSVIQCVQITATEDFSQSCPELQHVVLERIVIDTNGTDGNFDIYMYDDGSSQALKIFDGEALNSTNEPFGYTLGEKVKGGTYFHKGIPVKGPCSVDMVGDTGLDAITITVFYRQEWQ